MEIEKEINNIDLKFYTQWIDHEDKGWMFTITIATPFVASTDNYDGDCGSDVLDTLSYLDEQAGDHNPKIGKVDTKTLKSLCDELKKIRNDTYPDDLVDSELSFKM
jgi:elongation factor P hydroxylase